MQMMEADGSMWVLLLGGWAAVVERTAAAT